MHPHLVPCALLISGLLRLTLFLLSAYYWKNSQLAFISASIRSHEAFISQFLHFVPLVLSHEETTLSTVTRHQV